MLKILYYVWPASEYAIQGLKVAYQEKCFKIELGLLAVTLVVLPFLHTTLILKFWLLNAMFMILIVELINTAIEAVIDRISLEYHELSKQAKDLGSAAVFIMLINALISWIVALFCY